MVAADGALGVGADQFDVWGWLDQADRPLASGAGLGGELACVRGGPVEGLNSLIKKLKRVAAGFRSFANYRLRILLACGGCNWDLLGTAPR